VAIVCLCPLFLTLDVTYMTDIPCFTAMILALCLWVDCPINPRFTSRRWMALGMATLAFTIREPAVLVALPICGQPIMAAWRQRDGRAFRRVTTLVAAWCACLGIMWLWRQGNHTSGFVPWHLSLAPTAALWIPGWLPSMLGLFTLPILVKSAPWSAVRGLLRRHPYRAWTIGICVIGFPILGAHVLHQPSPDSFQVGNYYAVDRVLPLAFRVVLYLAGLLSLSVSILVVCGAFAQARRDHTSLGRKVNGLALFTLGYSAVILALSTLGLPTFDRYWLIAIAVNMLIVERSAAYLRQADPVASVPGQGRHVVTTLAVTVTTAMLAFFGVAAYTDINTDQTPIWTLAAATSLHLPRGYQSEDIIANWVWDEYTYSLTAPSSPPDAFEGDGSYFFLSHDRYGSYLQMRGLSAYMCAPLKVREVSANHRVAADAIAVGPVVRGLFDTVQFEVVPIPHINCAASLARAVNDGD
jgi:hypothetical protein